MLTRAQIAILNRARATLDDVQRKLSTQEGFNEGRLAEACEAADTAVFNVINVASVYFDESQEGDLS